jgi:glycosyltransferase involved in cell wall biosynthesis
MSVLSFLLNDSRFGALLRGAERRFFEVSSRLKALGVQVIALEYRFSRRGASRGYTALRIRPVFQGHNVLSALYAAVRGVLACVKYQCAVVYVQCRFAWGKGLWVGVVTPYIVSCLGRRPLVIVFHHVQEEDFVERNPLVLRAYRKATCLAVSKSTAEDVKRCFHVGAVQVVGNGVTHPLSKAPTDGLKSYDCVYVGRIARAKGVFNLLRAWARVMERLPSAHLLLIGGVEGGVGEELCRAIDVHGLAANVTVAGYVPDAKMAQLLQASQVFVLPSLREGFSLAVAEAMAAGLPCIISDLPALREVYDSAALFVDPVNVAELSDAMLLVLLNAERREELREKGMRHVKQFSWDAVAAREFEILKTL